MGLFGGTKVVLPAEPILGILVLSIFFSKRTLATLNSIPLNALTMGITLFLLSLWVSSTQSSMLEVSLKFSLVNTCYMILGVWLAYSLQENKQWSLGHFLRLSAIPLAGISFYAIVNFIPYRFSPGAAMIVARPFFKDHTILASVWALFIPLYLLYPKWCGQTKNSFVNKVWPYALSMLLLFVVLVSSSRAAWLSLLVSLSLASFIYFGGKLKTLVLILGVCASIAYANKKPLENWLYASTATYSSVESNTSLENQLRSAGNIQSDVSNLERLNRWNCAIRMFNEKPFFGYGPGTYQFQYIPWQNTNEMTYISVTSPFVTKNGRGGSAHSEYLLALSENGFTGILAWFAIVGGAFHLLFKQIRTFSSKDRYISLALLLSLTTYFVHALFNNFLNTPSLGICFWLLIGFTLFQTSKIARNERA
jgi:O-antigen ligase